MSTWKIASIQFVGFYLLLLRLWTTCQELSYREIMSLNASCNPSDTCSRSRVEGWDSLIYNKCECGEYCKIHDTCCIDSVHLLSVETTLRADFECRMPYNGRYSYSLTDYYFLTAKCNEKWHGNTTIRSICEVELQTLRDPLLLVPATSLKTKRSYKNYFCALCNEDVTNLILWDIEIAPKFLQYDEHMNPLIIDEDSLLENLVFDENTQQWGLTKEKETSETSFEPITINFLPRNMINIARKCIPHLISDCDPSWKNEAVRRRCHSYMGIVYDTKSSEYEFVGYRNIHCLICNYAEYTEGELCSGIGGGKDSVGISFGMLLDVNPAGGKNVGRVRRCRDGESYDPFFKKCRTLVCALPGYTMIDGKCGKT